MNKSILSATFLSAIFCFSAVSSIVGKSPNNNLIANDAIDSEANSLESSARNVAFSNPTVERFEHGCTTGNLNNAKFAREISAGERTTYCEALQRVANQLNNTRWSSSLRSELQQIWDVFTSQDVTIRPMKAGVSGRIAAAAESFLPNSRNSGFKASLYLRPKFAKKDSFFMISMHELRHIYDFYTVWKTRGGMTQAELEKRGFRIMGKIAKETPASESFSRLPKLWDDDWSGLSQLQIDSKMESRINKYMAKSKFYKKLVRDPEKFFFGYTGPNRANVPTEITGGGKGARLPYLVKTKQSKAEIEQQVQDISFEIEKAANPQNPAELLAATIKNEKALYFKMDNFVYDQDLSLKCWKKKRTTGSYLRSRQIARSQKGKPLFQNQSIIMNSKGKSRMPSCVLNLDSISTDTTETFWSAPYLDDMPVKFEYFTEVDGVKVARYTVSKPTQRKFDEMAAKYPFINPFRVFFGTIFVSVKDSQIIKFWGSSFPEADTTGQNRNGALASYNATAVRQKLSSGIWVTTMLNTVAVANRGGKMKPFSYIVKYKNYRQATSDVVILDDVDEETVAALR